MNKKDTAKFTIRFNPKLASHLKAIKILNSISPRSKAQVLADALLMYNNTFGLVDVTNVEDVIINVPEAKPVNKQPKQETTAEEKTNNLVLDYDDSDGFIDEDIEDEDDSVSSEYDSVFAQSLLGMGFKKPESEE